MSYRLGGRGRKAPYTSSVVRVPSPILPQVEKLISEFYRLEDSPQDPQGLPKVLTREEAAAAAAVALGQKKSARVTVRKLLQVIFDDPTSAL